MGTLKGFALPFGPPPATPPRSLRSASPCPPAMVRGEQRGRARSARVGRGGLSVPKPPWGSSPAPHATRVRTQTQTTMRRLKRRLLVSAVWALGSCTFSPNLPNGNVICHKSSDCPSGYLCEPVAQLRGAVRVCCKDALCFSTLGPDQIGQIATAAGISQYDGGYGHEAGGDGAEALDGLAGSDAAADVSATPDGPFAPTASLDGPNHSLPDDGAGPDL